MPEIAGELAAAALALGFGAAALPKIAAPRRWVSAVAAYRLSRPAGVAAAAGVPLAELLVAALVVTGRGRAAAALALTLLVAFSAAILRARRIRGRRLPCGCFGARKTRDYRALLARNAALVLIAVGVLTAGAEVQALDALTLPASGELLPALLALAGVAAAAWTLRSARIALRRWGDL